MPTCLDPIWERYETAVAALKVARRCIDVPGINRDRAFRNTDLYRVPDVACVSRMADAGRDLDDSAVLTLYARFEARLREHLAGQSPLLGRANAPDPQFGAGLAALFERQCESIRMDVVTDLFRSAVGQVTVDQVGSIRTYRHWLAHGRTRLAPPTLSPQFTFATLTAFLTAAGLA